MSRDLGGMLNRSTPFAPTSEDEISKRLESPRPGQAADAKTRPSTLPPESQTTHDDVQEESETAKWEVYVPVAEKPHRDDGPVVVEYEVRETEQGSGAVLVYTSPEILQGELGQFQPMVKVDIIELLHHIHGQVPVVVNPTLKSGVQRRQAEEDQ
ncbi:SseB family protein [Actinomadura rugatobispora]|uniref:SseB family protein n=1 Tax=Actinomadura rugatobispora TaxID=1994 RepID=A0ABW1A596_9ACTN|nr:hypothetical protein GCM10010200_063290 [Actinomadura rugatobispora]